MQLEKNSVDRVTMSANSSSSYTNQKLRNNVDYRPKRNYYGYEGIHFNKLLDIHG
jgi:hypothetical protein